MSLEAKVQQLIALMRELSRQEVHLLSESQIGQIKMEARDLIDSLNFAKTISFRVGDTVEFIDKRLSTGVVHVRGTVQKVNTKSLKVQQTNGLRRNPLWNVSGALCTKVNP